MAGRPSSAKRGYDYAWRQFRAEFLRKNPICCRQGCREPATDVDHEPPLNGKDDPGRLDEKRCAPLCHSHHSEKTGKQTAAKGYEKHRDNMAGESRGRSTAGRDIGEIPPPENPEEREKAEESLKFFLERYFPNTFTKPWSDDQLLGIEDMERIIVKGGLKCFAEPRGDGKTMRSARASLWAILTGRRSFVMLLAATKDLAEKIIRIIKHELQFNDLLYVDFPEVCKPIRKLDNEARRQARQEFDGELTMITLKADEIVFPTVAGSECSGSVIRAAGLTGAIKGQVVTTADGHSIRPDLVILDDPQDRDSAKSMAQNAFRESLINGDVLGLAGPGEEIACVMNCTVIYRNDLCDRYLNTEKYPTWDGRRSKLLYSFPNEMELWDQYADIRRQSFRTYKDNREGNEFYLANRETMDEGAKAGWLHRYNKDEHSAIQNAMNLKIDRPLAFASEFQNDPESDALAAGAKELTADAIANRLNGLDRYVVPRECGTVTAFIDPGGYLHWYMVVAWTPRLGGAVLDYGCWPRQARSHFVASDARPKLADTYKGGNPERVFAGLRDLTAEMFGRKYFQEVTGAEIKCERILIDCGFETTAVYQFVRQLQTPGIIVMPSKGVSRTATARGIMEWKLHPGEKRGHYWRQTISETGRGQMIQFDPDAWKSICYEQMTVPLGGPTALTLYGKRADVHGMVSEHLASEYSEPVTLRGMTFDKWQTMPDRGENHWLDCLVGSAVAASICGLQWTASGTLVDTKPRKKLTQADINAREANRRVIGAVA